MICWSPTQNELGHQALCPGQANPSAHFLDKYTRNLWKIVKLRKAIFWNYNAMQAVSRILDNKLLLFGCIGTPLEN